LFDHAVKYTGKSRQEKITSVIERMGDADTLFVNVLEEVSWLVNIKATG